MDENPENVMDPPESLQKNPTSFEWLVELQRVLNGDRERSLLQLQSVSAHIEKIVSRSDDVALSRACFQDALKQIVQGWQPNERFTKEYLVCMLDLITAYVPLEGVAKVLGLLKRWGTFSNSIESSGGYGAESDLNLQALVVLESYFPIGPHDKLLDQSRIYRDYVRLLLDYLEAPKYGGYAAARLIGLEIIEISDERIGQLIRTDASALYELLSLFFSPPRRARLQSDLREVFPHVIRSKEEVKSLFEEVLQIYSARLVHEPPTAQIILADRSKIEMICEMDASEDTQISVRAQGSLQHARLTAQISQVPALLKKGNEESRRSVWQIFEQCLLAGSNWIEQFVYTLKGTGGRLEHDSREVRIILAEGTRFGEALSVEARIAYFAWFTRSSDVPQRTAMISTLEFAAQGSPG